MDDEPEVAESILEQQGTQITVPKFVTSDYVGQGATVLVSQLVEPAVTLRDVKEDHVEDLRNNMLAVGM